MNELALFAGAGGGILGGMLLGWRTVCAVEYNSHCRDVLLSRQRDSILEKFPIWDDVQTFDGTQWRGRVDVVSGGFPCQRFSSAARGRNNAEDLWPEMLRIVGEVEPTFVFAENVSRAAIEIAAEDLGALGYTCRAVEVSASDLGADHERPRCWLRAYANDKGELCRAIDAEMAVRSRIRPSVWETYPNESGMADGMAYRMERFRAIGNGQVPAVAALAWQVLSNT